jgi:hypothetical protein
VLPEKTMQNSPEARLANPFQNLLVGRPPHNIFKCINFFLAHIADGIQKQSNIFYQLYIYI